MEIFKLGKSSSSSPKKGRSSSKNDAPSSKKSILRCDCKDSIHPVKTGTASSSKTGAKQASSSSPFSYTSGSYKLNFDPNTATDVHVSTQIYLVCAPPCKNKGKK